MFSSRYYVPSDLIPSLQANYETAGCMQRTQRVTISSQAIILPRIGFSGGVCDSNFRLLAGYRNHHNRMINGSLEIVASYRPSSIRKSPETVIFGGLLTDHFGHTITDSMTRLWFLATNPPPDPRLRIAFLFDDVNARGATELSAYHYELLELLGVSRERILIVREPTQFASIIIPAQACYWSSMYDPQLLLSVYDTILSKISPGTARKLYLSKSQVALRPGCSDTQVYNEAYFERFFSQRGYTILHPEQLTVKEQLAYISGAQSIACTAGTLSHLALFARNATQLVILLRAQHRPCLANWHQHIINKARELDFCFVDTSINLLPNMFVNLIGPTRYWQEFVQHELGEEQKMDLYEYLDTQTLQLGGYVKACLARLDQLNSTDLIGYQQTLLRTFGQHDAYPQFPEQKPCPFAGKTFCLTALLRADGGPLPMNQHIELEFCSDGQVRVSSDGAAGGGFYWYCTHHLLYLLNILHEAVYVFSATPFATRRADEPPQYAGHLVAEPGHLFCLSELPSA